MTQRRLEEIRQALDSAKGRLLAHPPELTFEDIEALVSAAERERERGLE